MMVGVHLIERIARFNALGQGELVDDMLDDSEDEDDVVGLGRLKKKRVGVNFMASPPIFSTTPSTFIDPFIIFSTPGVGPSSSHNAGNDIDKD
nr:hypothetical protein [Tanacetum cinerariifolium]